MDKQSTRIRFWSGLRTIGGTIVTVEHGQSRIIFDFGRSFSPAGKMLERRASELTDPVASFLRLGLLPQLDGLYAAESLEAVGSPLSPAGEGELQQAVLISHLHLDHMALMGMLAPSVPVWMSEDSLRLYEALRQIGEGVPEVPGRSFAAIDYERPAVCGEISVTPFRVDHDIAGACAFLIETPDVRLLYTGDFRLHGSHPEWTRHMAQEAGRRRVQVLMIEGTTIGTTEMAEAGEFSGEAAPPASEGSVTARAAAAMQAAAGVAVFNLYHWHIERIESFCEAARLSGRTPVLEPNTALLLKQLTGQSYPEGDPGILSEQPVEGYTTYMYRDINAAPERFAVQNSFSRVFDLLKLRAEGGVYIHSNGAPLGDYDPEYAVLRDLLRRAGLEYRYIGSSGHASPEDLRLIGEEIGADWYFPLHSLHPENLELATGIRILPQYGKEYCFAQGRLVTRNS